MPAENDHVKKPGVVIHIDRKRYDAPRDEMTGAEIRAIPDPPIGEDRDLWLEVPGGADRPASDEEVVELKNGTHFFTAPRTINPG